jgi:hypothetical protein
MGSQQMPTATDGENPTTESEAGGKSSRRDLVTKGAVAAAVAAVAAGALSNRVYAAPTIFEAGATNTNSDTTTLNGDSTLEAIRGNSSKNSAIYGEVTGLSNSHYGVRGFNTGTGGNAGAGVYGAMSGTTQPGIGVYGEETGGSGDGVKGKSNSGYGVRGDGPKGDFIASGSGKVLISKAGAPGPTATGTVGTIARDAAGALWYCYATNKWRELAGSTTSGAFHAISPKRVYDSRVGQEPLGVTKGKLGPGSTRVVDCSVAAEVPSAATAVVLNLTAANTTGLGNLAVYPDGSPAPTTSSINFTPGVNIANSTTSGCGPGAKVKVLAGGNTGADFIIDIVGYYV